MLLFVGLQKGLFGPHLAPQFGRLFIQGFNPRLLGLVLLLLGSQERLLSRDLLRLIPQKGLLGLILVFQRFLQGLTSLDYSFLPSADARGLSQFALIKY